MPKEWFHEAQKGIYLFVKLFNDVSFFSACYYLSYRHALREFNRRATEWSNELAQIYENTQSPMVTADNNENANVENNEPEDSVSAGVLPSQVIQPSTKYILEIYDRKEGVLKQTEQNPPGT